MTIGRLRRQLALACCAGLAVLGAVGPVRAALFDDNEARQRIETTNQQLDQLRRDLDARVVSLEQQVKNLGLVDIVNQIEGLKESVAKLRGQLEVVNYELGEAQKRQRDLYLDIDSRLRRLEAGSAAAGAPGPAPSSPVPPAVVPSPGGGASPSGSTSQPGTGVPTAGAPVAPGPPSAPPVAPPAGGNARPGVVSEQRAYDAARDQFTSGNYPAAILSFSAFVRSYPRSPLAPSAQYWIGNAQSAQRDFRVAIASQRQLLATYPDSQKVPDAMLNIATSQFELGDAAASRRTLEDLIARFPQSEAAAKARQRLAIR